MNTDESIFKATYRNYLAQMADTDLPARADWLGGSPTATGMALEFFNRPLTISADGITDADGIRPNFSACVIICQYVLRRKSPAPIDTQWAAFKDFKDTAPLRQFFQTNVTDAIAEQYGGRPNDLITAAARIGGATVGTGLNYDCQIRIQALPKMPVWVLFNDTDDDFPAQATLLFQRDAEVFLDGESLAMIGGQVAWHLLEEFDKNSL